MNDIIVPAVYVSSVHLVYQNNRTDYIFWLNIFRLEELQVLDIKFLYGCSKPTIVVLYQVPPRPPQMFLFYIHMFINSYVF